MRLTRLSEIDLARAMNVPPGPKLDAEMRNYNSGGGTWSCQPARDSIADVIAARSTLLGPMKPVEWPQLNRQITAACKRGQMQVQSNCQVSKLLFEVAREYGWCAVLASMGSMSVGFGDNVRYWNNVVLEDTNGPFIPFFDHRRSRGLANSEVRRIVFSMQHIGVRERYPDLSGYRLAVIRFPASGQDRSLLVHFHDGRELLSYDELNGRVQSVYAAWAKVSEEKTTGARRAAGGGTPFGF